MNDAAQATHGPNGVPRDGQTNGARILTGQLFRVRNGHGWAFTEKPPAPPPAPVRRPARVAQTLALAHRLQAAIDRGDYRDRADLARNSASPVPA